ncbi:hypothetical protein Poli38472_009866 [Pythium oligandrum]|uniref:Uncharacterized protein n=1 Tax=Pythium oligandrum TaxID=41045 RepID=A0A8K1CG33_PYTOL|nr:hypothetical protein Poli38472_009866 [Pythium oligandrum]|eukprot:TMW62373.1 hypothetical protein Poli38472_009866 [Pythium oligandrum]
MGDGQMPQENQAEDDDARRVSAFQARCAAVRQQTADEMARLAARRSSLQAQLGITTETMARWRVEHERMLQQATKPT